MSKKDSQIQKGTEKHPDISATQTVAVGTAQHKAQGNLAVLLMMAQNSTADLQAQIMDMARKEQVHRHEISAQNEQHLYELNQERMQLDFKLQEKQLRNIYRTDIIGKVVGSVFFLGLAAVAFCLIWNNKIRELMMLLGCTAVLGIFIKAFLWLMGVNHSEQTRR